MDPIADLIAVVSLGVSITAIKLGRRDANARSDLETKLAEQQREHERALAEQQRQHDRALAEQQRRLQTEVDQPNLVPTGGQFQFAGGLPHRLMAAGETIIDVHNTGMSTPTDVTAVLFPSEEYYQQPGPIPAKRIHGLFGTYWLGKLEVNPATNAFARITMQTQRGPLNGDLCVIEGVTLYAPMEPEDKPIQHERFYTARLTMTYRDRTGRTLAVAHDLDAITDQWRHVAGPTEVAADLQFLIDEAQRAWQPPIYPSPLVAEAPNQPE